jgi:hypothetical protein
MLTIAYNVSQRSEIEYVAFYDVFHNFAQRQRQRDGPVIGHYAGISFLEYRSDQGVLPVSR